MTDIIKHSLGVRLSRTRIDIKWILYFFEIRNIVYYLMEILRTLESSVIKKIESLLNQENERNII